jgi:hypothetical protein
MSYFSVLLQPFARDLCEPAALKFPPSGNIEIPAEQRVHCRYCE